MPQRHAVVVYAKPNCGPCTATKRRLDRHGITYTLVDITEDQAAYDHVIELGHREAPVVELSDGTNWSGLHLDRIDALKETA